MDESPYSAPQSPLEQGAKPRWTRWLLFGCLGSLVALMLMAGSCVLIYKQASHVAEPEGEHYLALWNKGEDHEIYDQLSSDWKTKDGFETVEHFLGPMRNLMGPIQSKTKSGFYINESNGKKLARLTYATTFEKGTGTITLALEQEDGQWRLAGMNIRSTRLAEAQLCPSCHHQNEGLGSLCGNCGKPLPMMKAAGF